MAACGRPRHVRRLARFCGDHVGRDTPLDPGIRAATASNASVAGPPAQFDPRCSLRTTGSRVSRLDCGRTRCGCKCSVASAARGAKRLQDQNQRSRPCGGMSASPPKADLYQDSGIAVNANRRQRAVVTMGLRITALMSALRLRLSDKSAKPQPQMTHGLGKSQRLILDTLAAIEPNAAPVLVGYPTC